MILANETSSQANAFGHRVVFSAPGEVELEQFRREQVGAGTVGVRTLFTLLSTGTELTVLNRSFAPGTHWDSWAKFPFQPGYAAVAEVLEVGPEVEDFAIGDRVVARKGHASHHVVPAARCSLVPPAIDVALAPWFALAKIAYMGARAAAHGLGDRVVVIGAGPIGQMAVRWAHASGARQIGVVDPVDARLALAQRGGASHVTSKPANEAGDEIRRVFARDGPDVVIDSTGNAEVFAAALGMVRRFGRVVVLGDTGTPASQHLTSDVIVQGITVVGAHDGHHSGEAGHRDSERGIHSLFFDLVATGRFSLDALNTHTFRPEQCSEAYSLANERRGDTMGIVLDWRSL